MFIAKHMNIEKATPDGVECIRSPYNSLVLLPFDYVSFFPKNATGLSMEISLKSSSPNKALSSSPNRRSLDLVSTM